MANSSQLLIIISLVAPVLLKIFMSVGVLFDLVFDLLNMMQVVVSVQYLMPSKIIDGRFIGPSNVCQFLKILDSIVYFKPFENQIIKELIQKHQGSFSKMAQFINEFGAIFVAIIFMFALILIIGMILYLTRESPGKLNSLVQKIK